MFFTRFGKLIAHLMLWACAFRLATCLFIMFSTIDVESKDAAARRYIGTGGLASVGEAADKAALGIIIAVSLGIFCEISARRQQA